MLVKLSEGVQRKNEDSDSENYYSSKVILGILFTVKDKLSSSYHQNHNYNFSTFFFLLINRIESLAVFTKVSRPPPLRDMMLHLPKYHVFFESTSKLGVLFF